MRRPAARRFPTAAAGLAIAGNPDRHPPPWQGATGHEIIPDTHENEATTCLFVTLFQDVMPGGPTWGGSMRRQIKHARLGHANSGLASRIEPP
jgi:hypothetical protein